MSRLEEVGQSADGSNGQHKGRAGAEEGTGTVVIVVDLVLARAAVGVLVLALALRLATDIRVHVVERAASLLDVLGALDIEGALDGLERGEFEANRPKGLEPYTIEERRQV